MESSKKSRVRPWLFCLALIGLGVSFRLYRITASEFVYWDEGYYLNFNRHLLSIIESQLSFNPLFLYHAIGSSLQTALSSNKFLWYGLLDFRVYFLGVDAWYFPRVISAAAGLATCYITYLLARHFFQSSSMAKWASALLLFLPSHLYYSRLGMQESLSTLFLVWGFYLYLTHHNFSWKTVVTGIIFSCVYLTNYRMIILPILLFASEIFLSICGGRKLDWRKLTWSMIGFFVVVVALGGLYGGQNASATFTWMFQQQGMAKGHFDFFSLLSYPYYIFHLEGILIGLFFFSNILYLFRREKQKAFPFVIVILQMALFSLPQEKALRYICVVLPFLCMAVVTTAADLYRLCEKRRLRHFALGLFILMSVLLLQKDITITRFRTDYAMAVKDLQNTPKKGGVASSQPWVLKLYTDFPERVTFIPYTQPLLLHLHQNGYKYLVLGPQAYVIWTEDGKRFNQKLLPYLEHIRQHVKPLYVYPHFEHALLERFVFDHSENLARSHRFLVANKDNQFGALRVYDLDQVVSVLEEDPIAP